MPHDPPRSPAAAMESAPRSRSSARARSPSPNSTRPSRDQQDADALAVARALPDREAALVVDAGAREVARDVGRQPQQVQRPGHQQFVADLLGHRQALLPERARRPGPARSRRPPPGSGAPRRRPGGRRARGRSPGSPRAGRAPRRGRAGARQPARAAQRLDPRRRRLRRARQRPLQPAPALGVVAAQPTRTTPAPPPAAARRRRPAAGSSPAPRAGCRARPPGGRARRAGRGPRRLRLGLLGQRQEVGEVPVAHALRPRPASASRSGAYWRTVSSSR